MVSRATDPIGTAMLDYQRHGAVQGECLYRDGADTMDGHVHENYFVARDEWADDTHERLRAVEGPVVDVGCGAGQHSVWFQDHGVDVVAFDLSPGAVEAARERGVEDARVLDMFDIAEDFPRDRFRTAWVNGTQLGLTGSLAGAREFLSDLARVTDEDGAAMVDNYRPRELEPDFFGHRPDPRDGVAHRTLHFEYHRDPPEGEAVTDAGRRSDDGREHLVGRNLHFVLFGPDRLRDVTVGTPWTVDRVDTRGVIYKAILRKE